MTVSDTHAAIVDFEVQSYRRRGYKAIDVVCKAHYRPDAIMESCKEIVLIEAVITSDHDISPPVLRAFVDYFGKPVRAVKAYSLFPHPKFDHPTTLYIDVDVMKAIKHIAIDIDSEITEIVNSALSEYVKAHAKK